MIPIEGQPSKKLAMYIHSTDGKGTYPMRRAEAIIRDLTGIEIILIHHHSLSPTSLGIQTVSIEHISTLYQTLTDIKPTLFIRDSGSTSLEEVEKIKEIVPTVMHFDDFGDGGQLADLVIQTLYSETNEEVLDNTVEGYETFIADENLLAYQNIGLQREDSDTPPHLVISFGDEDPGNLSYRALRHLLQLQIPLKVTVLIGENYKHDLSTLRMMALGRRNTLIEQSSKTFAEVASTADVVLCSSGYMPYEVAVMGIPCVVLAQNEFELTLAFPKEERGFVHLGAGWKVKQSSLLNAIMEPLLHDSLRKKAVERQISLRLGGGKDTICEAIHYFLEYPTRKTVESSGKETSDML